VRRRIIERQRKNQKHWKPYTGPPDWSFIVLVDVPKKEEEEIRNGRSEVSHG